MLYLNNNNKQPQPQTIHHSILHFSPAAEETRWDATSFTGHQGTAAELPELACWHVLTSQARLASWSVSIPTAPSVDSPGFVQVVSHYLLQEVYPLPFSTWDTPLKTTTSRSGTGDSDYNLKLVSVNMKSIFKTTVGKPVSNTKQSSCWKGS